MSGKAPTTGVCERSEQAWWEMKANASGASGASEASERIGLQKSSGGGISQKWRFEDVHNLQLPHQRFNHAKTSLRDGGCCKLRVELLQPNHLRCLALSPSLAHRL